MKQLRTEIEIAEKEIADVEVGHEVALEARAYPNRTFHGVVTSIGATARPEWPSLGMSSPPPSTGNGGGAKTILVTTEIRNDSLLLKPGMTGQAKISSGERRMIDLAIRWLVRSLKVEFWSWW